MLLVLDEVGALHFFSHLVPNHLHTAVVRPDTKHIDVILVVSRPRLGMNIPLDSFVGAVNERRAARCVSTRSHD